MQGDVHLIYIDEAEAEKLVEVVNRIGLEAEACSFKCLCIC